MKLKFSRTDQEKLINKARTSKNEWRYQGVWYIQAKDKYILHLIQEIEGQEFGHVPPDGGLDIVPIHTHPKIIYGDVPYVPPSPTDYSSCITAYFGNDNPFSIVFDPLNIWVYRPNKSFIESYGKLFRGLYSTNGPKPTKAGLAKIDEIFEVIQNNSSLSMDKIIKQEISLQEYIFEINIAIDGEKCGFDVYNVPIASDETSTSAYFLSQLGLEKNID